MIVPRYTCGHCLREFQFYGNGVIHCNWCGKPYTFGNYINDTKGNKMTKQTTSPTQYGAGEFWEVEVDCVTECSKAPDKIIVFMGLIAKVKIDALMKEMPSIEWFAYLLGKKEENDFIVEDIHVPDQSVTQTSVSDINCPEYNKLPIIGAMHSHHGMGNGFSGHDHEYVNGNHNLSLVIAENGIAGQARWTTPCGALKVVDVVIKPKFDIDFDEAGFIKATMPNIKKQSYNTTTYHAGRGGYIPAHARAGTGFGGQTQAQKKYTGSGSIKEAAGQANGTGNSGDDSGGDDDNQELIDALTDAFGPIA